MITEDDLLGRTLGDYQLTRRLGQGGMSVIYLAKWLSTQPRFVAVKILQPPRRENVEDFATFRERFRREARIIARLKHPHIVPIFDYGEEDDLAYIVMQYEKSSLEGILKTRGTLSLERTSTYLAQICEALDYAHGKGIIHRDLKPSNILLDENNQAVLADFGISRIRISNNPYDQVTLTGTDIVLGTPAYMAPEMFRTREFGYSVDIYALGIILYEMLSGDLPFKGREIDLMEQHERKALPSLYERHFKIPRAVDQVLSKAAAKRPGDRYLRASELARDFHRAIQPLSRPAATYEPPQSYPAQRSSNKHQAVRPPHHLHGEVGSMQDLPLRPAAPHRHEPVSNRGNSRPPVSVPPRAYNSKPPGGLQREPGRSRPPVQRTPPKRKSVDVFWLSVALILVIGIGAYAFSGHQQGDPVQSTTPAPTRSANVATVQGPTVDDAKNAFSQYNDYINQRQFDQAYQMLGPQKKQKISLQQFTDGFTNTKKQSIAFKQVLSGANQNQFRVEVIITATEVSSTHTYDWQGTMTRLPNGIWQIDNYSQQRI
ncbi:serine/threonine protein kinase [Ktedonobacter racemifer]|uniref:non-specific serine/threonine protein kinase n=1 Tax=Ktedonobacter racemifer DSM 44963 TaxID=485913 RepID=D6TDR2_KTERA|nr:serine/threonine-protein kinase [Ktedonobacter racemifer]EFH90194.1 serine/threonine protein kinase [Ktedonobacter racemifer DSM 44963]